MYLNNNNPDSSLEKIVSLALGKSKPDGSVKTSIVSLHLSQMREWGTRGGNIQIKAIQDFNDIRKQYIADLMADNFIKQRLESTMNHLVARGEVLWLVKPSDSVDSGYAIDFFVGGKDNPDPDYHVFYSEANRRIIECVVIQEEFETNLPNLYGESPNSFLGNAVNGSLNKKWDITFIDKQSSIKWTFDQKPLSLQSLYYWYAAFRNKEANFMGMSIKTPTETPNVFYPNFPFVICKNSSTKTNEPGLDDFTPLKDSIEDHNELLLGAGKNLKVFYTPTLVTSRDAASVVDEVRRSQESTLVNNSWAGQNGFRSIFNVSEPSYRMPQVIGNIKDGERFGYVQAPDVVSGDHNLYIRQLRELVHWTLGGVDPLGISASATFGEIKSLFGRIENTAYRKADILLGDKGFCKLLTLVINNEENKAKVAMTKFIVHQYLNGDPSAAAIVQQEMTDAVFRDLYFYITQQLGMKLPGLPPLGKQDCAWRYTKDVFERTTRDQLDASIVYRNAREDGIAQNIALAQLYPNMRDDEIRDSMSGFSSRVVTAQMEGIQSLMGLHNAMMGMPDPMNPEVPWAFRMGTGQLIEQGIKTIQKELAWTQPDFVDEVNFDVVDVEINQALQQLRSLQQNVQSSPSATYAGSLPSANSGIPPTRQ